jgi:hypothetical protein
MARQNTARALVTVTFALGMVLAACSAAYANTESDFVPWTTGAPNDTSLPTPHKDYQTTTQKCAVCHAVHKAPADGELLLRGLAGDSCVYCHITNTTGVVQIYFGDSSLYYTDNKKNHSRDGGAPCTGCHAVHGANAYGGDIADKILKRLPIQPSFLRFFSAEDSANVIYEATGTAMYPAPPNDWEPWDDARYVQQTAFCTGCHPYYTRASEDEITTDRMIVDGAISTETTSFASHPMKRQWSSYPPDAWDFQADGSSLPDGTRVTVMSTNGCWKCHGNNAFVDQGPGSFESSYPHYTANRERFLISGDGLEARDLDTPDSRQDGTCFLCHLWLDQNTGLPVGAGLTY